MNLHFRRDRQAAPLRATGPERTHVLTSDFSSALCRFVLDCSCGAHFDTPFIDEALEYREMHERLAPLVDQMAD